jgi:hypothetical protein
MPPRHSPASAPVGGPGLIPGFPALPNQAPAVIPPIGDDEIAFGPFEAIPNIFDDYDIEDEINRKTINQYLEETDIKAKEIGKNSLYDRFTLETVDLSSTGEDNSTIKNMELWTSSHNMVLFLIFEYQRIYDLIERRIMNYLFSYNGTKVFKQAQVNIAEKLKRQLEKALQNLGSNEKFIREQISKKNEELEHSAENEEVKAAATLDADPTTKLLATIVDKLAPSSNGDKMKFNFMKKTYETSSLKDFFDLKNQPKVVYQFNTKVNYQEWIKKVEIQFRANTFTSIFINNSNIEDAYRNFCNIRRVDEMNGNNQWLKIVQREFLNFNTIAYTYIIDCLTNIMVESLENKIQTAISTGKRKRVPEILSFHDDVKGDNKNFNTNYYDLMEELQTSYGILKENEISHYLEHWKSIQYIPYENPTHFYERLLQAKSYLEKIEPSWSNRTPAAIGWEVLQDKIPNICDFKGILRQTNDVTLESVQKGHQIWWDSLDDFKKKQRIYSKNNDEEYEQKAYKKNNKRPSEQIQAVNDNNNNNNGKTRYPYPQALRDKLSYLPSDEWKKLSSDQQRKNIENNRRIIAEYFKEHPNEKIMGYSTKEKPANKFMKKDKNKNQKHVSFSNDNEENQNSNDKVYNTDGTIKLNKPRILMMRELDSPISENFNSPNSSDDEYPDENFILSASTSQKRKSEIDNNSELEDEESESSDHEKDEAENKILISNLDKQHQEFTRYAKEKGWSYKWILDSGATLHALHNHSLINHDKLEKLPNPIRIETLGGIVNSHLQTDIEIHPNIELTGVRVIDGKDTTGMNIISGSKAVSGNHLTGIMMANNFYLTTTITESFLNWVKEHAVMKFHLKDGVYVYDMNHDERDDLNESGVKIFKDDRLREMEKYKDDKSKDKSKSKKHKQSSKENLSSISPLKTKSSFSQTVNRKVKDNSQENPEIKSKESHEGKEDQMVNMEPTFSFPQVQMKTRSAKDKEQYESPALFSPHTLIPKKNTSEVARITKVTPTTIPEKSVFAPKPVENTPPVSLSQIPNNVEISQKEITEKKNQLHVLRETIKELKHKINQLDSTFDKADKTSDYEDYSEITDDEITPIFNQVKDDYILNSNSIHFTEEIENEDYNSPENPL